MNTAARVAGIAEVSDPTADAPKEISREAGLDTYVSRKSETQSRVSLPLSHQRSFSISSKYRPGSTNGAPHVHGNDGDATAGAEDVDQEEEQSDIVWDSSHPCWPHLNVHQPLDSTLYHSTRIIRIRRDWTLAGDLAPTFSGLYPEVLEPMMTQEQFQDLITHLNEELIRILDPYKPRAWIDAGLGLVTGWLWDDLGMTGVKKDLAKLEKWLEDWNHTHGNPPTFQIIPLKRTAYLNLDIQVPNPQISMDFEPTEADSRSVADTNLAKSSRALGSRKGSNIARTPSKAKSEAAASSVGRPTDDGAYGAYPIVPPIPGKYLEEAQQNVSKQGSPRIAGPA